MLRRATFTGENWIARFGHLLDRAPSRQFGILYDSLVNAVRAEIPDHVETIWTKALSIATRSNTYVAISATAMSHRNTHAFFPPALDGGPASAVVVAAGRLKKSTATESV